MKRSILQTLVLSLAILAAIALLMVVVSVADASTALPDRQIASVAKAAGFTGSNQITATAVCLAESGGYADDISRTHDYGLWQIHRSAWPELMTAKVMASGSWKVPSVNAGFAYRIYKIQGWRAWVAYTNGRYKKFLARAQIAVSSYGR